MTAGSQTSNAAAVEAIDAQARSLYRRLRDAGPSYTGLAGATRSLHAVLKDLRTEARDLGSLLNTSSPIYSVDATRELLPLLDQSDITLKQVADAFGKYSLSDSNAKNSSNFDNPSSSSLSADNTDGSSRSTLASATNTSSASAKAKQKAPAVATTPFSSLPAENVSREHDTFALARSRIQDHTAKFILYFERVSLRNPPPSISTIASTASPPLSASPHPPLPPIIRPSSISPMPPEDESIETIKDRVDAIALRLSQQQDLVSASQFGTAPVDELWQVFYSELLYEGFSTEALSTHQEILQAYIRDLISKGFFQGSGVLPSQLPAQERLQLLPPFMVPGPSPSTPLQRPRTDKAEERPEESSPKEVVQPFDGNEKYHHSVKENRLIALPQYDYMPYRPAPEAASGSGSQSFPDPVPPHTQESPTMSEDRQLVLSPTTLAARASTPRTVPVPPQLHTLSPSSSPSAEDYNYTPNSSSDSDSDNGYNRDFSLMSTRELLAIDWRAQEAFAARVGVTYLYPQLLQNGNTPSQLPAPPSPTAAEPSSSGQAVPPPIPPKYEITPAGASLIRQNSLQDHLRPPVPPTKITPGALPIQIPAQSSSHLSLPEPDHHQYSTSAPEAPTPVDQSAAFGIVIPASTAKSTPPQYMLSLGLAPDSKGNVIPPDAIWTRISRRLVSPEVLEKAGVRYEARPSFVAVLGMLDKKTIGEYARQSAEARRSRYSSTRARGQQMPRNSPPDDRRTAYGPGAVTAGAVAGAALGAAAMAASGSSSGSRPAADDRSRLRRRQSMPDVGDNRGSRDSRDDRDRDPRDRPAANTTKARTFPLDKNSSSARDGERDKGKSTSAYPFIVSPPATEVNGGTPGGGVGGVMPDGFVPVRPESQPKSILKNKNTNQVRFKDGKLVEVGPDGSESGKAKNDRHGTHHGSHHGHHSGHHSSHHRSSSRHRDRSRHRDSSTHRPRDRDRDHSRSRSDDDDRNRRRDDSDRDRDRDRRDRERDRERERERERDRDRDRDRERDRSRARDKDDRDKDYDARRRRRPDDRSRDRDRSDDSSRDRDRDRERDRDRDRNRSRDRDSRLQSQRSYRDLSSRRDRDSRDSRDSRERERDRERDRERNSRDRSDKDGRDRDGGRKRFRDTLNAAGIGGAAGSLLTVLTEAASGF